MIGVVEVVRADWFVDGAEPEAIEPGASISDEIPMSECGSG